MTDEQHHPTLTEIKHLVETAERLKSLEINAKAHREIHERDREVLNSALAEHTVRHLHDNEVREQLVAQRAEFVPRDIYDTHIEAWSSWRRAVDTTLTRLTFGVTAGLALAGLAIAYFR